MKKHIVNISMAATSTFLMAWYISYAIFSIVEGMDMVSYMSGPDEMVLIAFDEMPNLIFAALDYSFLVFVPLFVMMYFKSRKELTTALSKKVTDINRKDYLSLFFICIKTALYLLLIYGVEKLLPSISMDKEINYFFLSLFLIQLNPVTLKVFYYVIRNFLRLHHQEVTYEDQHKEVIKKKVLGFTYEEIRCKDEFKPFYDIPTNKELINIFGIALIGLSCGVASLYAGGVSGTYTFKFIEMTGNTFVSSKSECFIAEFGKEDPEMDCLFNYNDSHKNGNLISFLGFYQHYDRDNIDDNFKLYDHLTIALQVNSRLFMEDNWASKQPGPNTYTKLKDLYAVGTRDKDQSLYEYKLAIENNTLKSLLFTIDNLEKGEANFIDIIVRAFLMDREEKESK